MSYAIELKSVHVSLDRKQVLSDIDLTIEQGDFMTFLGPSGCGKTTLLRTIAGLQRMDKGALTILGRQVADGETNLHVPAAKRGLSLVFQSYALWPHMTVFENIAFGLEVRKLSKAAIRENVQAALEKMRIPDLEKRYPHELSGGQQQRVAIARAIVTKPDILLMDEPLSNLDAKLRMEMRAEIKRLHRELNTTIIYVTHDQQEALTLSTKVAVFFEGRIVQIDTPLQLYKHPNSLQVADFVGNAGLGLNTIEGESVDSSYIQTPLGGFPLAGEPLQTARPWTIAVKPEDIRLSKDPLPGAFSAKVLAVFPSGTETLIEIEAGGVKLAARVVGEADFEADSTLYAFIKAENANIYNKTTGQRLLDTYPINRELEATL